ncbi:hypothetical protein C2869_14055 [Saccharobesus litoralis]|uniref:Killing trait domain-containing protein n=1 Tax=Saccharobesus litoralis TaxID=2172099 RepID=A0A2S0VTH8_9ALTE|nr:RebB family R body protein [Saccharobesus litoralis]AWB67493.1 hypothetical protein C2869_14055 [Saccharobesus litoralis]
MSSSSPAETCNKLVEQYAPTIARSMLVQTAAQALANASLNATAVQQQQNLLINTNTAISSALLQAVGAAYAK